MELLGDGEDDVVILDGEDVLLPRLDPAGLVEGLALGAVTISAGVIPDLLMPTAVAGLDMAAERRRAAARDRADGAFLLRRELQKLIAVRAEDVGQFQATGGRTGSVHVQRLGGTGSVRPDRSSSGLFVSWRQVLDTWV